MTFVLQKIAEPLLYRHIVLPTTSGVEALADRLVASGFTETSPARWIRSLSISCRGSYDHLGLPEVVSALTMLSIYATGLLRFEVSEGAVPLTVLALLQHPGRAQLTHIGLPLAINRHNMLEHVSRFRHLRDLRLWLFPSGVNHPEISALAWSFSYLTDLRVHIDDFVNFEEQQLLGFLVLCSFPALRFFSWLNDDWCDGWEPDGLTQFLRHNPTITDLCLSIIDIKEAPLAPLARVLADAACPRVTIIGPFVAHTLPDNPLSNRVQELVLHCHWGDIPEEWVSGLWRLLDAVLQHHRDTDALRRIVIAKITEHEAFGWLDARKSDGQVIIAGKLATYIPRFRQKGIGMLDGHGLELQLQRPPS
jgi:hypothetical protein